MKRIEVRNFEIGNDLPIVLIAGPCALESKEHAFFMAREIDEISRNVGMDFIFKTSFDKANRTSGTSPRGVGYEAALPIFRDLMYEGHVLLTDVHEPWQCAGIAEVVDVIQIPAFLCRQTDLITEAASTNCVINLKKGQFLSPQEMKPAIDKVVAEGNEKILITDRGVSFGYNTLVSDMRGLAIMSEWGYPIVFDATHSVQTPGGLGWISGGQREYAPVLARAATAVGIGATFMEVHDDPDNAVSDGPNMIRLNELESILEKIKQIDEVVKNQYDVTTDFLGFDGDEM